MALWVLASGCSVERGPEVVVYTSVDQTYAEPILARFAERTNIRVRPVFDLEAAKTTGLASRIAAERKRPQADVFWGGEFVNTIQLQHQGLLTPYTPASASDVPERFRDPNSYWTGVGGRARILLVNTTRVPPEARPRSVLDLATDTWPAADIGIARPLFGTSLTHAAALFAGAGAERAGGFYRALAHRGVAVLDGNSVVRDFVAAGRLAVGLTDTDDGCAAIERGAPVAIIVPDQEEGGMGAVVVPGSVALVAGGPHPAEARALVDFLASRDVEEMLSRSGWSQVPLRPGRGISPCVGVDRLLVTPAMPFQVFEQLAAAREALRSAFQ